MEHHQGRVEDPQGQGRQDGGEGDEAGAAQDHQPDGEGGQRGDRRDAHEDAHGREDPFAPAESGEHGEGVTHDGGQPAPQGERLVGGTPFEPAPPGPQQHRAKSLGEVHQGHWQSGFPAQHPVDVRQAGVPGSVLPDVQPGEDARDPDGARDGTQQVAQRYGEPDGHGSSELGWRGEK